MITKRNTIICDECGLFSGYFDEYIPFGCPDPEYPEPYEPSHICKKCFPKVKKEWIDKFKEAIREGHKINFGDWQKSRAEAEAAEERGLVWIASGGHGMLNSKNFADSYQYISKKEYNRLSKFPYWGYCKVCKKERKNGYCSDNKCKESFNYSENLK